MADFAFVAGLSDDWLVESANPQKEEFVDAPHFEDTVMSMGNIVDEFSRKRDFFVDSLNNELTHSRSPSSPVSPTSGFSLSLKRKFEPPANAGPPSSELRPDALVQQDGVLEPFKYIPHIHPLRAKYAPVIRSIYPNLRLDGRELLPMCVFPNDISLAVREEQPQPAWHSFLLPQGDGKPDLFATCIVFWIPLSAAETQIFDRRFREWYSLYLSSEQKEMSISLRDKIVAEKITLSSLLSDLPFAESPNNRQDLNRAIASCEERIQAFTSMMCDLYQGAMPSLEELTSMGVSCWKPHAVGIVGRHPNMQTFYRDWLRLVIAPMLQLEHAPPFDDWLPLERFVHNLCVDIPQQLDRDSLKLEVEVGNAHLFTRISTSFDVHDFGDVDLYPLVHALSVEKIVVLFEAATQEKNIVFLSQCPSILYSASRALLSLLFPLHWQGLYLPVLPKRLFSVMDNSRPFIVGIQPDGTSTSISFPFLTCNLDEDHITVPPSLHLQSIPYRYKKKLLYLLSMSAPMKGVKRGIPRSSLEAYPYGTMPISNHLLSNVQKSSKISILVGEHSSVFRKNDPSPQAPVFHAFGTEQLRNLPQRQMFTHLSTTHMRKSSLLDRASIVSHKRFRLSAHKSFDRFMNKSDSLTLVPRQPTPLPDNAYFNEYYVPGRATPSITGFTSLAPSTIYDANRGLGNIGDTQQFTDEQGNTWIEGHCFNLQRFNGEAKICAISKEPLDVAYYQCMACGLTVSQQSLSEVYLPCESSSFDSDKIRASFLRFFTNVFLNFRRYIMPDKASGKPKFLIDEFCRHVPHDLTEYIRTLSQTAAFDALVQYRLTHSITDPEIAFFDRLLDAKRNKNKFRLFRRKTPNYLHATWAVSASQHIVRVPVNKDMNDDAKQLHITRGIPFIFDENLAPNS
ncbi:hypothetical protein SJAG_04329 [Schizosaccharomyces japonicus yFS275]|uniref:UDENN domain-containing protein n=1 Tax=Schizosaccharomyces japonicus (strain yFS275 / FY16936) TaxID=402676 RepID=B6K6J6_SCHJY|nr:hypothetical protein SJAG_04329 [Schizosaccharomyces japonicus yFS275]EEB09150.1 hypothetical protein SJAG_04329 [Schizosaccharomyces japonicus yFS275]